MSDNPFNIKSNPLQQRSNTPSVKYCQHTVEEILEEFETDAKDGLSNYHDIAHRRTVYGNNELTGKEEDSLLKKFFMKFYEDPLILLLIGSAIISLWMNNVDDAVSITLAIVIVVSVGFIQEYRSEKSLEALNNLVPAEAHLTRNGNTSTVLASSLVPGDLVHFNQGDRVPADVRLITSVNLFVDESNLTGENVPVRKLTEPVQIKGSIIPVSDRSSIAFMGTLVRNGHGSGVVIGTNEKTEFGSVFQMMSQIEKPKTPLQQAMDKLGQQLSLFSFIIIGVICLIGIIQGRSWLDMFQISVSLAVAAIPEGLPIIVTVTLALGVLRMANKKAIVKKLPSVETLGSVNVICSDKTGTITENHMTVTKLWTFDYEANYRTPFLELENFNHREAKNLITENMYKMLETANICNNAIYSKESEKYIGNPSDIALVESLPVFGLEDMRGTRQRISEVTFSSRRKYMAVCVHSGDINKVETFAKGANENMLAHCSMYYNEKGEIKPLTDELKQSISKKASAMAADGLRVIAFARNNKKFVEDESSEDEIIDLTFCGLIGLKDPPRKNVGSSVSLLAKSGVHVIMITGDSPTTAANIARQIGISTLSEDAVMTGSELDKLDAETLAHRIHRVTVFARTTPEHKVLIVKALQKRGDIVAVTGDGVNDAPALKLADIGVAMGRNGTDVAKEAADMVLVDDDFSTILNAIKEGKGIYNNIQNFVSFQLSTSIAALSLIAIATFFRLPNPLNAMQILWINILMDGPPAQSLGVEPVDPEVLNQPIRRRESVILKRDVIRRILSSASIIVVGTMFIFIKEMTDNEITTRDTTMTFTCFVFFDMFNALSCRHFSKSVFELGLRNKMLNLAIAGSILGQLCAIYFPFFQSVFQTEALSFSDLVYLFFISSTVFIGDEVRKYFLRKSLPGIDYYNV